MNIISEIYSTPIDDHRAVEVHISDTGEHWVGMTHIRDPRDWEFHPKEQYGTGEVGARMAIAAADQWAGGLRFDATR